MKAAGCAWSWYCPIESLLKKINYFMIKKMQGFHLQKLFKHFLPGICYLLNLPNGFQNSARKSAHC